MLLRGTLKDIAAALFAEVRTSKPEPLYAADGRSLLIDTFDAIDARWRSIERYLDEVVGVDATQIARLRAAYLE